MDRNSQQIQRGRPVSGLDAAHANEYFEQFLNATSLKHILGYYRGLTDNLHLKPNEFPLFYPKLRANLTSWRAKALWKKFDARASHKCYQKGKLAGNTRVLIIGGGPCGMRTAIEAQLLGAKVVVIEKRDRFSRNNVLHLWPFVIEDLRMLGAKKFFGKFCAGAIDHISIRQLQCILLKVALLLGVEVHTEVSFEKLVEPNATEKTGWRAEVKPANHPVHHYEFDVIIGADGKRNTLQGFSRKEFRGKLAIAITANFINRKTEAEARVEEISGVAFIFNQKFFKDLQEETRIDLENIVYYKDDTHYFVMTAKKASLLEKGVIKEDLADTEKLLAPDNVDRKALEQYAIDAANFSTNYQLPNLEFAVNHYGQPDIAMFDFTSMYAAENASKVLERNGYKLLLILVGDSLLEPFWPTGSGCARGFLSSLDAAWAIRSWSLGATTALEVLAERESIYRLLAQTTPDNLNKDWKSYTVDPTTRYPNLNKTAVLAHQVASLYDTDNPGSVEKMKRNLAEPTNEVPRKRRRGNVDNEILLGWLRQQLKEESDIQINGVESVFKGGKALCALIHHYRPDLLDYVAVKDEDPVKNNQTAFDILEKEIGIPPVMTGEEITKTDDYLTMASYLTEVYDTFRREIPHIKHPKLDLPESKKLGSELSFKTVKSGFEGAFGPPLRPSSRHKRHIEAPPSKTTGLDKKTRKRRTLEKMGSNVEERLKTLEEIACNRAERQNRRRQQRKLQTEQFLKSMQMLQANAKADSQPFEDYSIFLYRQTAPKFEDRVKDLEKQFTYVPDHDNKSALPSGRSGGTDEDLAARIKTLEKKWTEQQPVDKKPKDLMRAIGKIETTDWNIKEIEKKILENKMGKPTKTFDKEKVPKWSKEQFLARQNKMESKHLDRQDSNEVKYADIDKSIKNLDQKLKEGTIRQLGTNKVASLTEKLVSKIPNEPKTPEKNNPKTPVVVSSGSEYCHFCRKRVYLMERLSAEGRFFHHSCFKCQYCNVQLRLGSYAFDRDGMYGFRFFCLHHFGMIGEIDQSRIARKSPQKLLEHKSPEKKPLPGIAGVDLLDRVQTPERVEFANLSTDHVSSDQDEPLSQIDEDEWTDKNFGASCAELGDSDEDSSSISDTDSDDEAAFDDALEEPITKEGTMKWAERWKNSYSKKRHKSESDDYTSSDQSSYYDSSDDDESDTATEGEEEIRARELRKQEVRVDPPVVQTDTGTDTEIVSDESSSDSSSEVHNSATEISTDSEFAQDDPTPTRELPSIALNDLVTRKGGRSYPKKIQVTSGYLQRPVRESIELKLKPLVLSSPPSKPALVPSRAIESGYSLNRTQSTGGIAAKVSLELKKKYLLGESCASGIQKSGSVSTLDTKFKTFQNAITDCQKLLRPANEISASMQTFCSKLDERRSPRIAEEKPEEEVRPRSPAHQTSIIVPQIDWSKNTHLISSDSLATSDSDNNPGPNFENIPTVQVHEARDEDALFDSLIDQNAHKSITSEKKSLNQPKTLPDLETSHDSLHIKLSRKEEDSQKNSSGLSSPEEPITAALTETELSDWARDDEASDDLEDVLNECEKNKTNKFEGGKNMIITEALNGLLSSNLDNIEFMDTETSSDDGIQNSQDGYVLLKDEDEFAEDSLSPDVRIETPVKNTGYCIIEPMTPKLNANELEDDSLLVLETTTGTTTEENTLSDSTVKNVTEISAEKLENKDALEVINENTSDIEKIEFDEHCQRLQSKVEFGNAKDSINVRKSRRKSKSDSPQKPDLIQEERIDKDVITLNLSPTPHTPDILYNKEIIKKERDVNKKLIQEMVMNKMRAENKSLERKKRVRSGVSPTTPFTLAKSATVAHITTTDNVVSQNNDRKSIYSTSSSNYSTPDVLLSTNLISQLPDDFTPKAPPRLHRFNSEESHRKLEKLKQAAVKLQDKEEIEDVVNVERRDSWLYSNDTLSKKKNGSFRRSKSGDSDTPKKSIQGMPKKEINLEEKTEEDPKGKKKGKDRERRKSITKMITTLFTKKSPSGLFSKLSPKSKEISKEIAVKQPVRRNSISETTQRIALTPPPVPPLPTNYAIKATDESSDGESEYKKDHHGSSDMLDKAGTLEMSTSSNTGRRSTKAQKALRQAQLKRHRMAQEIQRKLEETEVKTKELEERGVSVEKALRGEGDLGEYTGKDECELLQEWFDLMRDRTELRRYEKELIVRAQELELEDRHARLQCELRARLENNEPKTEGELKLEEKIINEMMTIVSERDSLIATIEEDRLRYSNEDRDMEEQMLAKGLRLTPIKSPDK